MVDVAGESMASFTGVSSFAGGAGSTIDLSFSLGTCRETVRLGLPGLVLRRALLVALVLADLRRSLAMMALLVGGPMGCSLQGNEKRSRSGGQ